MDYTVCQLAALAGVSPRTLRWYDEIGLLKPQRTRENGYRRYGPAQVDRLQQILFYRALGVELSQIKTILDDPAFDRREALRGHLRQLQEKQAQTECLIRSVTETILAIERNEIMSDEAKFEAFKRQAVQENEQAYGAQLRARYGDRVVDESNGRALSLTQEEQQDKTALEQEILTKLAHAVTQKASPLGPEGQAIAALHKQWLTYSWARYTPQAHAGVARMYTEDQRFTDYYDRSVAGCAVFLRDTILHWLGQD